MNPHTITLVVEHNIKGIPKYYTYVLEGVHYQDKQGVRTGSTDHFTDNEGYVQIPHSIKGYVSPQEWIELPEQDKKTKWTLKNEDLVIKGTFINQESPHKTKGARSIKGHENVDYGIILDGHYGVYLV